MVVEENPGSDPSSSCHATSNWNISDGSLVNTVTVESTSSLIKDSRISSSKSPLILRRPASDFIPCDITISFAQKHEVHEVYVRSTAQTYKIYCAPNLQGETTYLHFVGCSVVADEGLLQAFDGDLLTESKKQVDEKSKRDSNNSTSEEDWVEVKRPDSPPLDRTINMNSGRTQQNFYEAMAEFNGAEPCTSLTLRMQSLQDEGCIYVEEVYVFADPVDSAELDDQQGQAGKSKLDKTDEPVQKMVSERSESANTYNKHDLEIKSNIVDQPEDKVSEHIQSQVPSINSNSESTSPETSLPNNCLERAMDQLVSRVSKIEDIFFRFEERILKPISSIDARLERVEQQLDKLTMRPQCSGSISGTRFSAPDFLSTPPKNMCAPVNGSKLVHMHTAPEFPNIDDEEQLNGTESVTDKPMESVSIDEALASALTGYISSTYTRALAVKAPEFSNDEDGNEDVVASPKNQSEIAIDSTISKNQPGEKVLPSFTPLTSPLSVEPSAPPFSLPNLSLTAPTSSTVAPSYSSRPVTSISESPCTEVQPSMSKFSLKTDDKAVTEPDSSTTGGFGFKLESSVSSAPAFEVSTVFSQPNLSSVTSVVSGAVLQRPLSSSVSATTGSVPYYSTAPRTNIFGGSFGNTSVNSGCPLFTLKNPTVELFRPATLSFQSPPPQQTVLNPFPFPGGFGTGTTAQAHLSGGGFGQSSRIEPGEQQAHGSVLGGFGQSRPHGAGLPGVSGFASASSFGGGFMSAQPTGGSFGNTANGGGFAIASSDGGGFNAFTSHGGGGFFGSGFPTAGGFGMGTSVQAHPTGAGFGQPSQIGPGHGCFGQSRLFAPASSFGGGFTSTQPTGGGFANTATGGGFAGAASGGFGQSRTFGVSDFAPASSFGDGFTSTQPTGGGFVNTASGGGFTRAASGGFGQSRPFGVSDFSPASSFGDGFTSTQSTGGGFANTATGGGLTSAASGGFGQSRPFGVSDFAPDSSFGGFANTATGGGFTGAASGGGGFTAFTSHDGGGFGAGGFAGTASSSGFPTSGGGFGAFSKSQGSLYSPCGFGAFNNLQESGVFSAFGGSGTGKPAPEVLFTQMRR